MSNNPECLIFIISGFKWIFLKEKKLSKKKTNTYIYILLKILASSFCFFRLWIKCGALVNSDCDLIILVIILPEIVIVKLLIIIFE